MGCDYGTILMVGVKLLSVDEIFIYKKELYFNCEHEEKDHEYCPKCGKKARRVSNIRVDKFELPDDFWGIQHDEPTLFGYYLNYEPDTSDEVHIGTFKKFKYETAAWISLGVNPLIDALERCEAMMKILDEKGIKYDRESLGIHIIPYVSC